MTPQSLANSYRERANGDVEAALDAACKDIMAVCAELEALSGNVSAGFQRQRRTEDLRLPGEFDFVPSVTTNHT